MVIHLCISMYFLADHSYGSTNVRSSPAIGTQAKTVSALFLSSLFAVEAFNLIRLSHFL